MRFGWPRADRRSAQDVRQFSMVALVVLWVHLVRHLEQVSWVFHECCRKITGSAASSRDTTQPAGVSMTNSSDPPLMPKKMPSHSASMSCTSLLLSVRYKIFSRHAEGMAPGRDVPMQ